MTIDLFKTIAKIDKLRTQSLRNRLTDVYKLTSILSDNNNNFLHHFADPRGNAFDCE